MGDPVTISLIAGTLISAAGTAYSAYQAGQTGRINEDIARNEAVAVREKAAYDEGRHRQRVRQLLSRQRALFGASGVELAGSPLLALEDTVAQGEMDALAIRHRGETEARRLITGGQLSRRRGRDAAIAGGIRTGSTLLSGFGRTRQQQIRTQD
jgi:hypothetical protein